MEDHGSVPRSLDLALREAKNRCRSQQTTKSQTVPTICINYHGQVQKEGEMKKREEQNELELCN